MVKTLTTLSQDERCLKMDKILLVDGNSLVYRAFFGSAYGPAGILTNSKGFPVNAISTFNRMLSKSIGIYEPTHVFVAFDAGKKTFRHEKLESYKAGRSATPPELIQQFPKVKEMLTLMGIRNYELANIEADDLIATLAKKYSSDAEIVVLSSDKDLHQLVMKNVMCAAPQNRGNPDKLLYMANFEVETGIRPDQVPDMKGLVGDPSDNLPGVKGIGLKGAIKLLNDYQTLDKIYENKADLTDSMIQKLDESKDIAFLCKELATLKYDVEIPFEMKDFIWNNETTEELLNFFKELEINSLVKKYSLEIKKNEKKEDKQLNFDSLLF